MKIHEVEKQRDELAIIADSKANLFNLRSFIAIIVLATIGLVLNEIGLFTVTKYIMRIVIAASSLIFATPILIYVFHDKIFKQKPSILEKPYLKMIIIACAYLGVALLTIAWSFQAVLLLVVPLLMASQYRSNKRIIIVVLIITTLMVPISIYGSFFFGIPDRNLIKGALTDEEALVLANRFAIATPKRMGELVYHYCLPRLLIILSIDALIIGITSRNNTMIKKQIELSNQIKEETERINKVQENVIEGLAGVIETRDSDTGDHVIRTKKYVALICQLLKQEGVYINQLDDKSIEKITNAAPLHDIGKIAISDTILLKPGRLTKEEFEKMKLHTEKGGEMVNTILKSMDYEEYVENAHDIALFHHEKWDGSGYPKGLKGENIPLSARIMAIADVFDALISRRVYKEPMPVDEAFNLILSESGTHFDPAIIEVIKKHKEEMTEATK